MVLILLQYLVIHISFQWASPTFVKVLTVNRYLFNLIFTIVMSKTYILIVNNVYRGIVIVTFNILTFSVNLIFLMKLINSNKIHEYTIVIK